MSHINHTTGALTPLQRWCIASIVALLCLLSGQVNMERASAQSAHDGFDPNADGVVRAIRVQEDGNILIGGAFTHIGLSTRNHLARLKNNGVLDATFNPNVDGDVYALAVQADGAIVVGGDFGRVGGVVRSRLARVNSAGVLDTLFSPSANGIVYAIAALGNGKLLVAGAFTQINGQAQPYLARLNSDGTVDASFAPVLNEAIYTLLVQRDGAIVIGGAFTQVNGATRNHIARLDASGDLDTTFNPDANDIVRAVALQFGGKILLGGDFTQVGGQPRTYMAQVSAMGVVDAAPAVALDAAVHTILVQADGGVVAGGAFTQAAGQPRQRLVRFTHDGALDAAFTPGFGDTVLALAEQPDNNLVIGGVFTQADGVTRRYLARLYPDGALDADFDPVVDAGGPEVNIKALAIQADGRILVGGSFTAIDGQPRRRLARLLPDGALDPTFVAGADQDIWAIAVQPDGKIIVAGGFTEINGEARQNIVRLLPNGAIDPTFMATANQFVLALALQPDGKMILGGDFTQVNGQTRQGLTRLNPDGSLDATFQADTSGRIITLALQPDGKVLVGGEFSRRDANGQIHDNLMRLHPDGAVDPTYNASTDNIVLALAPQADGRVVIGGSFMSVNGVTRHYVARLLADGALDPAFNPNVESQAGFVYSIAIQQDGQIILAGRFTVIGGQIRNRIARFTRDGALDPTYNPNVNPGEALGVIYATALQKDGKLVISGGFTDVDGVARTSLARLSATQPALHTLQGDASGMYVTWRHGGSAPELARTTFEYSVDGAAYVLLGAGARTVDGWQSPRVALPLNQEFFVRAHGVYPGGGFNVSVSELATTARAYLPGGDLELLTTVSPAQATPTWRVTTYQGADTIIFTDTLGANATTGSQPVGAGIYTVTLAADAGTNGGDYATTYACTVDGEPGPNGVGVSFQVAVHEMGVTRCTFTATRRTGLLDVVHKLEPSAASSAWDLRVDGPTSVTTTLTGDASTGLQPVFTGDYTLRLTPRVDALYTTSYTCTVNGQPLVSGQGIAATLAIAEAQTVVCTFTSRDFYVYPPYRVLLPNVRR
ncbi:MAG TPA: delta-60 repeat domain-containing protein [Chloroflexi bacterium]|nr:delta-60 repeat domain-containing protein [Chloroflexota bacterium]